MTTNKQVHSMWVPSHQAHVSEKISKPLWSYTIQQLYTGLGSFLEIQSSETRVWLTWILHIAISFFGPDSSNTVSDGLRRYLCFSPSNSILPQFSHIISSFPLPTSAGSWKKQESPRKISTSALLTMPKPLIVWIKINSGKFWKRWEYQTTWPAAWEICMQVRKQQLELDMEQQTGSK